MDLLSVSRQQVSALAKDHRLLALKHDGRKDQTSGLPVPETEAIPDAVLEESERPFGYVILPTP